MLLEHERYYGLGMDATVTICSWNTNVISVWAWVLWSPRAFGTRTFFVVSAWVLWSAYALGTRTFLWFGHGCYSAGMLLEHERYYGLGMGAPVTICSWNTNVIMVWAWMLSSSSALQHECHFGLGMDATVTVCSWNTNVIMVWAWMLQ